MAQNTRKDARNFAFWGDKFKILYFTDFVFEKLKNTMVPMGEN